MTRLQIAAVAICIILNALDGFDVLAISFSAPGITAEWGISRAELGIVLAMELIGMSFGSVLLGGVADRRGRRPIILGCLLLMAAGMYLASIVDTVNRFGLRLVLALAACWRLSMRWLRNIRMPVAAISMLH